LIPKEVREETAKNDVYGRREFYSHRKAIKEMKGYLGKLKKGEHVFVPPFNLIMGMGLAPAPGMRIPVEIHFSVDGKAYLFTGLSAFHAPQLSLGSWRRESLAEITQTNLPYKLNMLKHWFGMIRIRNPGKNERFNFIDRDNPKKVRLFGKYASGKFEAQRKVMRNRSPR